MTYDNLLTYLQGCSPAEDTLCVTGHPAPDTDAVVSALFEAWRLTLTGIPAVPAVQGALSRETRWLLGDAVNLPCVTSAAPARWALTDHHDTAVYGGQVVAILDHHPVAEGVSLAGIDVCIRPVGATTTLVVERLRQDGLVPDAACARILLGAILLDTEGLSPYKAKEEDIAAAAWLAALCGEPPMALYNTLREQLLSETDLDVLYERDIRHYTDRCGAPLMRFAILKVRQGAMPDRAALRRRLAADAAEGGYAATVAKIVLYAPDDSREEHYLAAGPAADLVLAEVLGRCGAAAVRTARDEVYLPPDCPHWGRKRYALWLMEALEQKT